MNAELLSSSLQTHFGFSDFRPGQRRVMEHLLAGHSAAAVFPTGGGKSLCYQLPALHLEGLTLVVSPLIALMKDQIDALAKRGIAARRLDGSLSAESYHETIQLARAGALKLLYVSPERFNNERFRALTRQLHVSLFAVDEAHCISEWGHNFRPDYLKLAGYASDCGAERCLALTATATPKVLEDICAAFDIAPEHATRTPFYRDNLTLSLRATPDEDARRGALARAISDTDGPTIVYVTRQKTAESVARRLRDLGHSAVAYHAGLDPEIRTERQDAFMRDDIRVVVATIAFGMGIDKPDIRAIIHYNLPKSLENYAQEIGRAGRDQRPSTCTLLVNPDDLGALENFVYGDTPSLQALRSFTHDLLGRGPELSVSVYHLAQEHDIRKLVVRTLLTRLELEGILRGGTPIYTTYRFKPAVSSAEILARFPRRRNFFVSLLSCAKKARTWFDIDLEEAIQATGTDRVTVIRALDGLAAQRLMEVRASNVRLPYTLLEQPDPDVLAERLYARSLEHERREIERLRRVIHFYEQTDCLASHLGAYFGEPLEEPCGHCSRCAGEPAPPLPERHPEDLDPSVWDAADRIAADTALLQQPRAMARFLCGITSPRISRLGLKRSGLFGALEGVPFKRVLERAQRA